MRQRSGWERCGHCENRRFKGVKHDVIGTPGGGPPNPTDQMRGQFAVKFKHANCMASVPDGIRHPTVKLLCENGVKLGLTLIPTWSRTFSPHPTPKAPQNQISL